MSQRPFQPWNLDQVREASRLRRCGCDAYTIAKMTGMEEARVAFLFFDQSHEQNITTGPCNQTESEAA